MTSKHNLPRQLTSFVGRERELAELAQLVVTAPLVTVSGPGGCGKSRLALQAAAALIERGSFPGGVYYVPLAAVNDPAMLLPTIARTLGVKESAGASLQDSLVEFLTKDATLLLLDNFEQLLAPGPAVDAAGLLAALLQACPRLQLLVTSRTTLELYGERQYRLPPLSLPPLTEAVALFVQRAQAGRPDFALTEDNRPLVEAICRRLDGLPLAIELAAARVRLMPLTAILARLEHRLDLLVGGARDLPARQQTLRNTLAWSYELLSLDERAVFRRLAVFAAGCTVEAAEAVCGGADLGVGRVLDGVTALVAKSLLRQEAATSAARLTMLDTIHEYALARLVESGEQDELRDRHLSFFTALAETAEPELTGPQQELWLARLAAEHDNLRAALDWGLGQEAGRAPQTQPGLRLAGALGRFWRTRGYFSEGRSRLERAIQLLSQAPPTPPAIWAQVLYAAGLLASGLGDYGEAAALFQECLAIRRQAGDTAGVATVLNNLGALAYVQGARDAARRLHEEGLALQRQLGNQAGMAASLHNLSQIALASGEYREAVRLTKGAITAWRASGHQRNVALALSGLGVMLLNQGKLEQASTPMQEALALSRELGDHWGVANARFSLALLADAQRAWTTAEGYYAETLTLYREAGYRLGIANSLWGLAAVAYATGRDARAGELYLESLALRQALGDKQGIADCLAGLAGLAARAGYPDRAAALCGAAEALREAAGSTLPAFEQARYQRLVTAIQAQLGPAGWKAAWQRGRAMPLAEAVAQAEAAADEGANPAPTPGPGRSLPAARPVFPAGLTRREVEVLRLVASGLTDAEVAARLSLSVQTVHAHLRNIYGKLDVGNRLEASRFAIEHNLA